MQTRSGSRTLTALTLALVALAAPACGGARVDVAPAAPQAGAPVWPDGARLQVGRPSAGRVTVFWTGAFDDGEVAAYRLVSAGETVATVPGAVTSAVVPEEVVADGLAVWAVDDGDRVSASPLSLP